jgi:hypothetical protein
VNSLTNIVSSIPHWAFVVFAPLVWLAMRGSVTFRRCGVFFPTIRAQRRGYYPNYGLQAIASAAISWLFA